MEDIIKNPNHYKIPGLEVESIDIIRGLTKEMKGTEAFYLGNIVKYLIRAEKKNGIEDYKKAKQYLEWLIDTKEGKVVV